MQGMPKFIFSVGPGAPFSKRVCGVPSFSRGRDNLQPRPPPATAQPKFGSKNLRFSFLPQNLRLTNVCAQPPPKKHTGHLFSTNFAKKAILWFWKFLCKNWPNWACRWACRSMLLGMSQHVAGHVAACRGDSCARRWACRSMSLHFWHLSLGMSQHFVPLLGVLRHFAGVWANFWPKSKFSGLASAPPCFSDSPCAQTSRGFSVFCQRGIGLKEGDFTLQRESKDFSAVAL